MNKHYLKRIYCFLVLMILVTGAAFAQGYNTTNWKFSNPKQFGFTLLDVDYFDNNTAIAVGTDGGIAKSIDAGRNWTYGGFTYINQAGFKVKATFNDVHFITASIAYAVGNGGVMVKTTDAGVTWNLVTTPLWANTKNINTLWFLDANQGYIAGQWNNTVDSLPKLYFTLNGGSTWDSIAAPPVNGLTRVGYINNVGVPSVLYPVDAKLKEIYRIEFANPTTAYISGSGSSLFPRVSITSSASPACVPNPAGNLTTGAHNAPLLWKFSNGVLTDYSISKERIGYTGINTNTVTCTTGFANLTPTTQTYRAMGIINDSTVVLMSFNNNTVVKVRTGVNDSTENVNAPGVYEKGKYEVLNFPFPPTQGPNAGPSIPPVQVLLASNPITIRKAASGKLIAGSQQSAFSGTPGSLWTSIDTGRNWIKEVPYPQTPNIIAAVPGAQVVDIAPNGRVLVMGVNGAVTDSIPGGSWQSNYVTVPVSAAYNDMEFTDCNNGIAAGGSSITVTIDGGNTWIDRFSPVLNALNASINSVNYLNPAKAYFTTSIGNIYRTTNQAVNLNPVFGEPLARVQDMAAIGNDSLWACGVFINFPLASAQRQGAVFRSFNNGATWDTVRVGPMGASTFLQFNKIDFPTRSIGYIAGNRNAIYKTIDGGTTWTDVSPIPSLNPNMTYTSIQALNKDTVFVTGNSFPNKVVYRTTNGGTTWVDITSNIIALGGGNINRVLMHNVDSGYVFSPGGFLYVTNNSGASWTLDIGPTACIFTTAAFVPRTVGAGVSMINRKMFVSGVNISGAPMMEYGNPANTTVNSTELIAGAACSTPNSGSITITATGGIAPYTYQLDAGAFQASNVFNGVSAGTHTITIKDAYCGLLTKTVTVALNDDQVLNTNITSATICAGAPVQLIASGNSTTYLWTPALGLSNPNIANPIATPLVTTTYTVTATLNSCVKTRSITINVNPNPGLVIVADPGTTLCEGDPTLLTVFDAGSATGATIPLGAQTGTFASLARGYFFTAPTNFTMTALRVPTDASAGNQHIAVVRFTGATPPPAFPGTTNAFTTLFLTQNNTTAGNIPVNIAINAGDVIGIMGTRGADVNSYRINPNTTTIGAFTVNLTRMGMQFPLATTAPQQIWTEAASISRVFFDYTIGTLGPQSTGTFLWSPALGLSSTTSNPVAASPMNTTTYTVTRTTVPAGCQASAQVTITVNKRPVVTAQPVSIVRCVGTTATFTVGATGTGVTYQWQVSTAGCAGPWVNLTNIAPYSGVNTATLTVNPVSGTMNGYAYRCVLGGTCAPVNNANISNCATLSVNLNPNIAITPVGPVCGGVAGINGTALTVTAGSPPVPGNASANSGVINVPIPDGTGVAAITNLTIAGVPANATITEIKVNMNINHTWVGDVDVNLRAPNNAILNLVGGLDGGTGGNATDNFTNTAFSSLGGSTISGFAPPRTGTFAAEARAGFGPIGFIQTVTTWAGLVPPATPLAANGQWTLAAGDFVGADAGTITNWSISVDYTTPGSGGAPVLTYAWSPLAGLYTNPTATTAYTGTNLSTVYAAPTVQTTYTVTATDVATGCFSTASVLVNYTPPAPTITPSSVAMCLGDAAVKLKSTSAIVASAAVWTPVTGLYSDALATIPYVAGTRVDSVWARPTPSGVYPYTVTVNNMISFAATPATPMAGGNGNFLVSFNVRNNNAFPVTLAGISSNAFGSGAVAVRSFYKTTGNAGNPGPISAANGFIQFGSSNVNVTANTLNPVLTGLTLSIPAGATYAIALDFTGATFPAYTNGAATTVTYTANGCDIITGGNVGWGGPNAPAAPVNNPRNFNGTVSFLVSGPGTCTSPGRTVIVTVNDPTTLNTSLPANQTICTDKVATFTVAVTAGTGPHSYQWQVSTNGGVTWTNIVNGGVYSGATTATLTITAPPVSMSGYQYRAIVTGAAPCAAQTSRVATLTVNPLPVVVISASPYTSLFPGLRTTLSSTVTPNPAGPNGYSWIRNGVVLTSPALGVVSGLGTGSLLIDVDGLGDYQLRVTDINGCTSTSNTITIKDSANGKCFIYPNPTSGKFQVRYYSVANNVLPRSLTIYDAKGDRVLTQFYTIGRPYDRMDVDMRGFGKGLYWVEIGDLNGNRLTMCRVVIQ